MTKGVRVVWRYNRPDDFWQVEFTEKVDNYVILHFKDNSEIRIPYTSILMWMEN